MNHVAHYGMRRVYYVAHPVSGDVNANIQRALRWLAWLRRSYPRITFVAPWIAGILSGENDDDPTQRESGLRDCEATVAKLDGIVLVGGRISSGMRRELDTARSYGREVTDMTHFGDEPPPVSAPDQETIL